MSRSHYGKYEKSNDVGNNVKFVHRKIEQDEISRPHYHDAIEFNVILKGTLECFVDEKSYVAVEGQIFCFNSMEAHHFIGKKDSEILCVLFKGTILDDFFESYSNNMEKPCLPLFLNDINKNSKSFQLLNEWERSLDDCSMLENKGYVNLFMGNLAKHYGLRYMQKDRYKLFAIDILNYLESNYKDDITLESIADHFGYSKTSVSRIFHKSLGQDIRSYLNIIRVEKVNLMLDKDPNINVVECAYECGFNNMNSFYRAYKQRFNRSPKRKKENGEEDV